MSPQAALLFLLLLQVPLLPLGGLCRLALLFARNRLLVGQRQVIDIPHLVAQCVALFLVLLGDLTVLRRRRMVFKSTRACAKQQLHKATPANTILFINDSFYIA